MSRNSNLYGSYKSDMRSGYYPPMSFDEWLYNINGVTEETNMEIEVSVYIADEDREYVRTYKVCASEDDFSSIYSYAKDAIIEDFPSYDDLEILSWKWLE